MLHVNSFGGGAVSLGAADTRKIDEVIVADSVDIGPRGALVCTTDASDYVELMDAAAVPSAWAKIFGIGPLVSIGTNWMVALGVGIPDNVAGSPLAFLLQNFARQGENSPVPFAPRGNYLRDMANNWVVFTQPEGVIVTLRQFPGVFEVSRPVPYASPIPVNIGLLCVGAREGYAPKSAPGLQVLLIDPSTAATGFLPTPIGWYDVLGTGEYGSLPTGGGAAGTKSQQMYPRGIELYNNFVFAWGWDAADTVNGDGPARVMFCNLGLPLKWGNDNIAPVIPPAAATDRFFTDSDAIVLGDAGEIIRAACRALGKLFFGTNIGLHFIQGYGRDTFITNGSVPVMKAFNTVGPTGLIEGPDRALWGVCDQGLWRYDGFNLPDPLFLKNWDMAGHSPGYWELLWTDASQPPGYPGRTNMDLVWMTVDYDRQQVLVGIPFCNASSGSGPGSDTVIIKYHLRTGGFTRQVFRGVAYTCAAFLRQSGAAAAGRFLSTDTGGIVRRYGYQPNAATSPVMPDVLPTFSFGPYAPFGPDGEGVVRRYYLTLSWEAPASLPLAFEVSTLTDDAMVNSYLLTIGSTEPVTPQNGDLWLDTSNSDPSIGNLVAGTTVPATGGALLKTRAMNGWQTIAGQGSKGTRATIQLPVVRRTGTRVIVELETVAARGRFQIEGLGIDPGDGVPNV